MPRLTREQNRQLDQIQRQVVTLKPQTVTGGFIPAAAIPFIAAAATPLLSKGANWLGHKIFGNGIRQAGAGLLRSGEKAPPPLSRVSIKGGGKAAFRAGDLKMPSMMPLPSYRTGTQAGTTGGMLLNSPGVPETLKKAIRAVTTVGGKRKGGQKKKANKSSC
jgi:hypothetical protein